MCNKGKAPRAYGIHGLMGVSVSEEANAESNKLKSESSGAPGWLSR